MDLHAPVEHNHIVSLYFLNSLTGIKSSFVNSLNPLTKYQLLLFKLISNSFFVTTLVNSKQSLALSEVGVDLFNPMTIKYILNFIRNQ